VCAEISSQARAPPSRFFFQPTNQEEERTEMEYICGKQAGQMDGLTLAARLAGYGKINLDLGTGDGRYVEQQARQNPGQFFIGLDACRENLVEVSRKAPGNSLFLIANAANLPLELAGLVDTITLNFPWGSLLEGLFETGASLVAGLRIVAKPGARLEVRLNESAIRQAGRTLETAREQVVVALQSGGFEVNSVEAVEVAGLKKFPSSWARRLASGREGKALLLSACYVGQQAIYFAESKSA
jgi:16S rRNA (adenine(1408)-N(1))-methyltransferase